MYPKRLDYPVIGKENEPVAETTSGKVRGLRYKEVCVFKGIPYAKAQRYHAPVPADPWEGTLDCTCYGPVCSETETLLPKEAWLVPHYWYLQSEHCQNLNIWTKHLGDNAARPVLVLLHGDGYAHGSSIERFAADGEEFCDREDVVVVSVNHRLNCLGYLDLSDYSEDYACSGNLGTADLVAALKWIRDNAAFFGGDPNRVMLYGLAGGGGKVITLLQTPAADGLYHCCAIHSGVNPSGQDGFTSKDSAKANARLIVEELGYTRENIQEIETLPFFKLAKAVTDVSKKLVAQGKPAICWSPVTDFCNFAGNPLVYGFREETLHIPLIVGCTLAEGQSQALDSEKEVYGPVSRWRAVDTAKRLGSRFGENWQEIMRKFTEAYPMYDPRSVYFLDFNQREGCLEFCKKRTAQGGGPVYNFLFTLTLPPYGGSYPWTDAETAYVLHNAQYLESEYIPGVSESLQDVMSDLWANFAAHQNPNGPGLPEWKPVGNGVYTLILDQTVELRLDHDTALIENSGVRTIQAPADSASVGYAGGPRAVV